MAAIILALGFFLIYPIAYIALSSFNTASHIFLDFEWGLDNWRQAWNEPRIVPALLHTFLIWGMTAAISLPVAVAIAWILARTNVRWSHGMEFLFWISFMMPGIAVTIAWIALLDPRIGMLNTAIELIPSVEDGPFNIYSVAGIVWVHLMANGIATKVMLLTPAFRNMDYAMEEAARVSGATNLGTMLRVTIPLMSSPIILVMAFQMLRIFQSFETEQLLGPPFGFYVYATLVYDFLKGDEIEFGQATVLGLVTMLIIVFIIPLQRWIVKRRRYTTITGGFRPGLIDLGRARPLVSGSLILLLFLLTLGPFILMVMGSFMLRMGYFHLTPVFTMMHWETIFENPLFWTALRTTLTLAFTASVLSPLLFSLLAYILVRTTWRGRTVLDSVIWSSGLLPGILSGLGLLIMVLGTPGLSVLYGTIWILIIVVVLSGKVTGVNIMKGSIIQVGFDLEDAARIAGASWLETYVRVWIPLLTPTLVMLSVINFVSAAGATSSVILLASTETMTLSILALDFAQRSGGSEIASIISTLMVLLSVGAALIARAIGMKIGIQHR